MTTYRSLNQKNITFRHIDDLVENNELTRVEKLTVSPRILFHLGVSIVYLDDLFGELHGHWTLILLLRILCKHATDSFLEGLSVLLKHILFAFEGQRWLE